MPTPPSRWPVVAEVLSGKRPVVQVFGNDYPTRDGTGERDYVHVVDVARAHVLTIDKMFQPDNGMPPFDVFNIGTGQGKTVLEVIAEIQAQHLEKPIPVEFVARRAGDVVSLVVNANKASLKLGWKAEL